MKNLKSWLNILRPLNVIITGCTVFIGALLTGSIFPLTKVILAIFSAAFVCAGENVLNDYFDIEIDRINAAQRPIPSGKIKKRDALIYSIILIIIGIILAAFIKPEALLLAIFVVILLVFYNAYLKRNTGVIGNMAVSITAALSIVYGGIATGRIGGTLFPALFAFLIHLGREIIKDIEDVSGDRMAKSCSIATGFGLRKSYYIGFTPLFLLIVVTPLPYLFQIYNLFYLIIVIFLVDILLISSFFFFRKKLDARNLHRLNNILKLGMVFGLLSLIIGIM